MSYDGWMEYNGVEVINLSRTAQLARTLNITTMRTTVRSVQWIQDELGGVDYENPINSPWYDPGYPGSVEFAGVVPLSMMGLDDSMLTRDGTENIGDGGNSGRARNGRLAIVGKVALVASTERGVEFGKRWLDRVLRDNGSAMFCSGADLRYFRWAGEDAPKAHRRDVKITRGTTVLNKRTGDCSTTWIVNFTLTADDSYEYGEETLMVADLGGTPTGDLLASGSIVLTQSSCPQFDYSPIYDPLYPALVEVPAVPDFYPDGWDLVPGQTFQRFWARVPPVQPSGLYSVPMIKLSTETDARMVRVSIWGSDSATDDQCGPLFSTIVSYLPSDGEFYVDGEQKASYLWEPGAEQVRRTDSLVYGPEAEPVQWTSFSDPTSLLITLDIFADSDGYEGDGDVRLEVSLIPKSD